MDSEELLSVVYETRKVYHKVIEENEILKKEIERLKCCGNCENEEYWYGEPDCQWLRVCSKYTSKAVVSHWEAKG